MLHHAKHAAAALLLGGACVLSPTASGKPAKAAALVKPGRIKIDGRFSAEEWATVETQAMVCMMPACGDPSGYVTNAWAAFDGTSLHFLVVTEFDRATKLVMKGNWGQRDGLEFALRDPRNKANPILSGYGFPDGTCQGHVVTGTPPALAKKLGEVMTYAATVEKHRWVAEFAIPLAKVNIPVEGLEKLHFNLNIRRICDATWMVWALTDGPVWDVDSAGVLYLRNGKAAAAAHKPEPIAVQHVHSSWLFRPDPDGVGVKQGWAKCADPAKWSDDKINWDGGMAGFRKYEGWAWCWRKIKPNALTAKKKHLLLVFPGVDEEC